MFLWIFQENGGRFIFGSAERFWKKTGIEMEYHSFIMRSLPPVPLLYPSTEVKKAVQYGDSDFKGKKI